MKLLLKRHRSAVEKETDKYVIHTFLLKNHFSLRSATTGSNWCKEVFRCEAALIAWHSPANTPYSDNPIHWSYTLPQWTTGCSLGTLWRQSYFQFFVKRSIQEQNKGDVNDAWRVTTYSVLTVPCSRPYRWIRLHRGCEDCYVSQHQLPT
jgi:hypothetical protein